MDIYRLLICAILATAALAGCGTTRRIVEEGGREYEQTERTVFGGRVWLTREPIPSRGEAARAAILGPLKTIFWISLIAAAAGLATAVALAQYGLRWLGVLLLSAGGPVACLSGALVFALHLMTWWIFAIVLLAAGLAVYAFWDRGLDSWIARVWRSYREIL